jgi:serine/threonine protein kinase
VDLYIDGLSDLVEIGSGANGIVYRAWQTELDRLVAVKVVRLAHDQDSLRRFDRERKTMASISLHPGIAPIFSSGLTASGQPYLVMPYYHAGSLADRLLQSGPIPWQEATDIIVQVANAIEHAHSFGVLHRDIKPANILLDQSGKAVIVDFGVATLGDLSGATTTGIHMTPAFAPPEAFDGVTPDRQFDVYSLGATLHALIAGQPPFTTEEGIVAIGAMKATRPPPSLRHLAPGAVCDCIDRAMAARPGHRSQSAADFAAELAAASATSSGQPVRLVLPDADPSLTRPAPVSHWDPPSAAPSSQTSPAYFAASPQPPPAASSSPGPYAPPAHHPPSQSYPQAPAQGAPPPSYPPPATSGPPSYPAPAAHHAPSPSFSPPAAPPSQPFYPQPPPSIAPYSSTGPHPPPGFNPAQARSPWLVPSLAVAGIVVALGLVGTWYAFRDDDTELETTPGSDSALESTTESVLGASNEGGTDPTGPDATAGTDSTPVSGGDDRTSGEATAEELRGGDCIDVPVDTGIFDTVTRRPCGESHNAEVTGVLEHPSAGGAYPGPDVLSQYGYTFCGPIFQSYVGVDEFSTELFSYGLSPTFDEWADGIYVVPCVASRWDYGSLSSTVRGQAGDRTISLEIGDTIPLHRLGLGACYATPDASAGSGLARLDGLQQAVELADCNAPHEGEVVGSADLEGPADGVYNFEALLDEADPKCLEQYTLYTGLATDETDGLFSIVPDLLEWESAARYTVCILLNTDGGTGSAATTT